MCGPAGSICLNQAGNYSCFCPLGYTNNGQDGTFCQDVDECADQAKCGAYGTCKNIPGGFQCICPEGFVLNEAGNECLHNRIGQCGRNCRFVPNNNSTGVDPNAMSDFGENVSNGPGTEGWDPSRGDGSNTIDPNDPNFDPNNPNNFQPKKNADGSWQCEFTGKPCTKPECCCQCLENYWADPNSGTATHFESGCPKPGTEAFKDMCPEGCGRVPSSDGNSAYGSKDIDECANNPDQDFCPNGKCVNTDSGYRCECNVGFASAIDDPNICIDIDECSGNNCNDEGSERCINTEGSYLCKCKDGYTTIPGTQQCIDIDECSNGQAHCTHRCENTQGSYKCHCPRGMEATDNGKCTDIDECKNTDFCTSPGMECINTVGSAECRCKEGTEQVGDQCIDIDECQLYGNKLCKNGACSNLSYDGYQCICDEGYTQSPDKKSCEDYRKGTCFLEYHAGFGLQTSANPNTHVTKDQCCCSVGQAWIPQTFTSIDTNIPNVEKCPDQNSQEFNDLCPYGQGFNKQGSDINDCEIIPNACNVGISTRTNAGICQNQAPSYQCICKPGFRPTADGKNCIDIDECDTSLMLENPCGDNSVCKNKEGSFECVCDEGYELKGDTLCVDVDECKTGENKCFDACINTIGSYKCSCANGYKLDSCKYLIFFSFTDHFFFLRNF